MEDEMKSGFILQCYRESCGSQKNKQYDVEVYLRYPIPEAHNERRKKVLVVLQVPL